MHLEFTETQSLIQQTARDYAQRRIVPVAAQIDRESRFPKDILNCLLYTSDAADELLCVDLGGRRIHKKKKQTTKQQL